MPGRHISEYQGPATQRLWNRGVSAKVKPLPCPTCGQPLDHRHPSKSTLCEQLHDARERLETLKGLNLIKDDPKVRQIVFGHFQKYHLHQGKPAQSPR